MTITAKVIADSVGARARRLTTFELMYPRFIHAEFMTHRHFSRNASSSRAIPVERQIETIMENPAMPVHWGMNQSGMQAEQESDALIYGDFCELDMIDNRLEGITSEEAWLKARDRAVEIAQGFVNAGYHKQVVNRLLEPFTHIKVVCTASNYDNFFHLRRHKDAQPEIKVLADAMWDALQDSTPRKLGKDEWHLPYVTDEERATLDIGDQIKISVARSARVSYKTHDGKATTIDADVKLYDRLVGSSPLHASPAEHQAKEDDVIWDGAGLKQWAQPWLHGNLQGGWIQFRKTLDGECVDHFEDPLNSFD